VLRPTSPSASVIRHQVLRCFPRRLGRGRPREQQACGLSIPTLRADLFFPVARTTESNVPYFWGGRPESRSSSRHASLKIS